MSLVGLIDRFADAADWIQGPLAAEDAIALSVTSPAWRRALSQPGQWWRYIYGPPAFLARPILSDPTIADMLASVHRANFRAVVAALSVPNWLRRYPAMKKCLASGSLCKPVHERKGGGRDGQARESHRSRSPLGTPKRRSTRKALIQKSPSKTKQNPSSSSISNSGMPGGHRGPTSEVDWKETDWDTILPPRRSQSSEHMQRSRIKGQMHIGLPPSQAQQRLAEVRDRVVAKSRNA